VTSFTPSWAQYRLYLIAILPIAGILLFLDFVRDRNTLPLVIISLGGILAALAVYVILFFRNYRVTGETHLLEIRSWLGITRTRGPDELDRVVLINGYIDNGVTVPYLLVLDRNGKRVLSLNGRFWSREQMMQLADALSISTDHLDVQRPLDLRRRYPRAVSFVAAHPYVSGLLLAIGVVIALVIGVAIYAAAT
jgi:hypothetical protein